jgi:hypothetical protein
MISSRPFNFRTIKAREALRTSAAVPHTARPRQRLPRNRSGLKTYPWAGIADVQVVSSFLGRVLRSCLPRDPVTERALLSLELARLVADMHPFGDLAGLVASDTINSSAHILSQDGPHIRRFKFTPAPSFLTLLAVYFEDRHSLLLYNRPPLSLEKKKRR